MKKNLKKLFSFVLVFVFAMSLMLTAFAAEVTSEDAKTVALNDAGYTVAEVSQLFVKSEYDDGIKLHEVSFIVVNADGSYLEYDYDVKAADGKILKKDVEREYGYSAQGNVPQTGTAANGSDIGENAATQAALAYFGLSSDEAVILEVYKDYEDGVLVYDIELCRPYTEKYSCEVVAANGTVRDVEKEYVNGFGEVIELFFEVLFAKLFGGR